VFQKGVKVFLYKHSFEALDIIQQGKKGNLVLYAALGTLSQTLGGGGHSLNVGSGVFREHPSNEQAVT